MNGIGTLLQKYDKFAGAPNLAYGFNCNPAAITM